MAFVSPQDGATVAGAVALEMVANGITIERDADHVHFGMAQTEGSIYLEPGEHDLCLQVGNGAHEATDVTHEISVLVEVSSREDWCKTVAEADTLFDATEASADEFALRQVAYENVRRLLFQLEAGLDHVDADAREAVGGSLAARKATAEAWATAVDEDAAQVARSEAVADNPTAAGPGTPWVLEHCLVDLGS